MFKNRTSDMPKFEHPSTFDETIPPYSYAAQDGGDSARRQGQNASKSSQRQDSRRQNFSPDGDAFETGYRPYARYRTQNRWHFWARPQQQRSIGRTIFFVLLAILLIPVLIKVLIILLSVLAFFFVGFVFVALILASLALVAFYLLRRSLRRVRRNFWW